MIKLDVAIKQRSNNLNFIRFLAALLVIVSHAFPLSFGERYADFLTTFSKGHLGLGGFAVGIFFLSSGFLVSKSAERNETIQNYFKARVLRIFPPLIFVVLLTVLLLGPIFTTHDISSYFTNPNSYKYLLNGLLIPIHNLPGVFDDNIYQGVINGALWTLPVEFICYIGLFVVYQMRILNHKLVYTIPIALIVFLSIYYIDIRLFQTLRIYSLPVFMFYIGMIFYVLKGKITLRVSVSSILLIAWMILTYLGFAEIAMVLCFPYIFFNIIYSKLQCNNVLAKTGVLSYGIYLCGFPIQQIIVFLNGGEMSAITNMLYSIPVAVLFGYIIYLVSEKPLTFNNKKRKI